VTAPPRTLSQPFAGRAGGELALFQPAAAGRPARIVTELDPDGFTEYGLNDVEAAQPTA
jgi:hypothetical protein